MKINESQNPAEVAAPEQETTAVPDSVEITAPEATETPQTETEKPPEQKVFTQEELDRIVAKEKAKAARKAEREALSRVNQQSKPVSADSLSADQFETYEDYAEALAEVKAQELIRQREIQQRQVSARNAYDDRVEKAMEKYDDFEQVAHGNHWRPTDPMVETIIESEVGPEIAYFLGSNPKEVERISELTPLQQAREIGKIEARLIADPPAKKVTSAPAPISPVTSRSATNPVYDTTDPRSTKTMSVSEWIEADRQRQIKKLQQNR